MFVEVKTKKGGEYGEPWEMINSHKLHQVQNMGHCGVRSMDGRGCVGLTWWGVWMGIDGGD